MSKNTAAVQFLHTAVESLVPHQQADGALLDPVFNTQTQYGTAYFGWCCAVLAETVGPEWCDRARAALTQALDHTSRPELPAHASGFDVATLGIAGRGNHRDFTWPPILRTFAALGSEDDLVATIAAVEPEQSFRARPPSNWASVWMSGEWLRMQAGLSTTTAEMFDDWIDVFFAEVLDIERGLFSERGLPNAYDLFTRTHLADLLVAGYDGRNADRLRAFLTAGLRRSLSLQLSDGSVASGYRSTAQTWVLGAQIAFFTAARQLGLGTPSEQQLAGVAAWRAFDSMRRWQRPDGPFSPVQNLHRPELRVGYEGYTADGHYSPLALSFLATAITRGFGEDDEPGIAELDHRDPAGWAEAEPTWRAVTHRGRMSAAIQSAADHVYDGCGLVDLTFGAGRRLHLATSARHLSGGPWLNPGLAIADQPYGTAIPLSGEVQTPVAPISLTDGGLAYETTFAADSRLDGSRYRLALTLTDSSVRVEERITGEDRQLSLLVPFLADDGGPDRTQLQWRPNGAELDLAGEKLIIELDAEIRRRVLIPEGYRNRRGRCGVIRFDLARPSSSLLWSIRSSR
ncbi:MAG TPA: hypothetical protein VIP98_14915 [Microlunatus sp.]